MILAIFSVFTALVFAQGPCYDQVPIEGSDTWQMPCSFLTTNTYTCNSDGIRSDSGDFCCCDRHYQPNEEGYCTVCPRDIHQQCEWIGTAPFCGASEGDCPTGSTPVVLAQTQGEGDEQCSEMGPYISHLQRPAHPTCPGFGNACSFGSKVYCCTIPDDYWACQDDYPAAREVAALYGFPDLRSCNKVFQYGACTMAEYEEDARRYCPQACGRCEE